jgi:hypothetical protein
MHTGLLQKSNPVSNGLVSAEACQRHWHNCKCHQLTFVANSYSTNVNTTVSVFLSLNRLSIGHSQTQPSVLYDTPSQMKELLEISGVRYPGV